MKIEQVNNINSNAIMKEFLDENFLLETKTAERLFHDHAKNQPIIDYHCHLPQKDVAENRNFTDLTEIWLKGDHYKWRAMRANGINERYCTGDATNFEKFQKWAETVPYTMRNPLYHWTHLELQRYFGINTILNGNTAKDIYDEASAKLNTPEYSAKEILHKMNVKVVCTTDDPADDLAYHKELKDSGFDVKILPTFRPDKAMMVDNAIDFVKYVEKLEKVTNTSISSFSDFISVIQSRHDFFAEMGGKLSDHGLETLYAEEFTEAQLSEIFNKVRSGKELTAEEIVTFKSGMLIILARMDHEKGWTQQFHLGAIRDNNPRANRELGPDTGFDSIGDFEMARAMSKFFGKLDDTNQLAKTIVYNLNPRDNYLFATMIGNYQDGSVAGKMQFGSGWWFLDQKEAMEWQMNALSNLGLLSRFVGMLTDSRSFLSYPRHEYFRRILCNLLGNDVEKGLLPNDMEFIGQMVENISYNNAKNFFNF